MASRVWLGDDVSVPVFCRGLRLGRCLGPWEHAKPYEQQPAFAWMGGHGTEPYEQNTQQSPGRGLSLSPHPLQS